MGVKHPTERQILFHLVGVAQTALDAGDSDLARHLVAEAYTGFASSDANATKPRGGRKSTP